MEVPVELSVMYDQLLRHDAELANPPAGLLNHQEMLGSLKVFLEANMTLSDFNNFHAVESSYKKELVCQILC